MGNSLYERVRISINETCDQLSDQISNISQIEEMDVSKIQAAVLDKLSGGEFNSAESVILDHIHQAQKFMREVSFNLEKCIYILEECI